jgi:hypothetical protein
MSDSEKYFFPTNGTIDSCCTEKCQVHKEAMIGSVCCQECSHLIESGGGDEFSGPKWIKCKVLLDARMTKPEISTNAPQISTPDIDELYHDWAGL